MTQSCHSFTLHLKGIEFTANNQDILVECGFDDAVFGERDGIIYLEVNREANSLQDAVYSAMNGLDQARKSGISEVSVADAPWSRVWEIVTDWREQYRQQ